MISTGVDLGLFTPNYDIEASEVTTYLEWLHSEHLPRTLDEGSFSAISHYEAVKAPKQFQLLESMPAYTSFHSESRLEAARLLPSNVAEMMTLRLGQVRNHHAEISRINGPSANTRKGQVAIGPAVCLLRFDIDPEGELNFNAWLDREHFQQAAKMAGLLSFRRYLAVEGAPANLLLYEFESTEAMGRNGVEQAWSTQWAEDVSATLKHDENSQVFYRRIWSQG
ncbi:hypothetical protein ACFL17_07520 [Pseudomonadota bacterium]